MSNEVSRRQLLKILAAATGTAMLSTVPNEWKTPVIDVGMIPAHAQGLSGTGTVAGFVYRAAIPAAPSHLSVSSPTIGTCPLPSSGDPFPGAKVEVEGYPSLFGISGLNGDYSIGNVPAGPQSLILTANNFSHPAVGPYTVPAGGTLCLNFIVQEIG